MTKIIIEERTIIFVHRNYEYMLSKISFLFRVKNITFRMDITPDNYYKFIRKVYSKL